MSDVFHASYFATRAAAPSGPGRAAIVGSVVLHVAVAALMLGNVFKAASEPLPEYKVYRVDIYSPPPNVAGEPEAAKAKPAIVKPPEQKQVTTAEKKPAPVKTQPKSVSTSKGGTSDVAKGRNPDPKALVGGEGIDVHMAGDEFPYPEYLENIIIQLNRYFRPTVGGRLVAQVRFEIMRDGSVRSIKVMQKSGNFNFDLDAMSAIEQAGKRGAFGPLPRGWVPDRLAIKFRFEPTGQ